MPRTRQVLPAPNGPTRAMTSRSAQASPKALPRAWVSAAEVVSPRHPPHPGGRRAGSMTTNPARVADKAGSAVAWETTSAAETHPPRQAFGEAFARSGVMGPLGALGARQTPPPSGIAGGLGVADA